MSFDCITRVEAQIQPLPYYSDFDKHAKSLSAQLSSIHNSVSRLSSLLEQVGGRRDGDDLRADIQKLLREMRETFKLTGEGVKKIQRWSVGNLSRSQQYTSENLSNTFTTLLTRFQSLQRVTAEIMLRCPPSTSLICESSEPSVIEPRSSSFGSAIAEQDEAKLQQAISLQREQEILLLQEGIEDINNLLKTLATIVGVQGNKLATIRGNAREAATDIGEANYELRNASRLHKQARNRACCLLLACTILFAVVLLAIVTG